jgi:hypothetical protein
MPGLTIARYGKTGVKVKFKFILKALNPRASGLRIRIVPETG